MKKILLSLLVIVLGLTFTPASVKAQSEDELLQICQQLAGDVDFLKDFRIKLDAGDPPPVTRFPIILKKNIKYRFTVASSKDYEGRIILNIYDNNRVLASTHVIATGKDYPNIDWVCSKTGAYHLVFSFKDGKEGLAVGIVSMVEAL